MGFLQIFQERQFSGDPIFPFGLFWSYFSPIISLEQGNIKAVKRKKEGKKPNGFPPFSPGKSAVCSDRLNTTKMEIVEFELR